MDERPAPEPGDVERSPGGSPLLRHRERTIPFQPTHGDPDVIDRVGDHIAAKIGEVACVYHEIVSDLVHVDVHIVAPTAERPFHTLVTSGMSEAPMTTPEAARSMRFAELMMRLPADWPLGIESNDAMQKALADERNYWPIRLLKSLARMPHEYDTWLGYGHTIASGDPPEPYVPGVPFQHAILLPSPHLAPDDHVLKVGDRETYFWAIYPLHPDELTFKLNHGADKLWDRMLNAGVSDLLDVKRKSVCRRKWFGLF